MRKDVKNQLEVCPNPLCRFHQKINLPKGSKEGKWFRGHGYYTTKQHEKIPRYICNNCNRTFTLRTGENFWHLKNDTLDVKELGRQWISGTTICEIAKTYGVSEQVIKTRLKRYEEFSKVFWEY